MKTVCTQDIKLKGYIMKVITENGQEDREIDYIDQDRDLKASFGYVPKLKTGERYFYTIDGECIIFRDIN